MDVAILGLPTSTPPTGVEALVLARERLVAVVSAKHPLASRRRLRLEDLAEEAFVDFPEGTPGRVPSDLAFHAAGVHREVIFEAVGANLILDLVRQDLAVALLSPTMVPTVADDLRTIPVVAGPIRVEYLAWSSFNPAPAAQALLEGLSAEGGSRARR